jgi:hypothetical protein
MKETQQLIESVANGKDVKQTLNEMQLMPSSCSNLINMVDDQTAKNKEIVTSILKNTAEQLDRTGIKYTIEVNNSSVWINWTN